jgi:hypothetical protein
MSPSACTSMPARRDVHQDGERGIDRFWPDGFLRYRSVAGPKVWCAPQVLCDKFSHTRFEPSGWSGNPKIGYAKSLTDYLFRWLELRFLKGEQGILFELQSLGQPRLGTRGSTVKALGQIVAWEMLPRARSAGR